MKKRNLYVYFAVITAVILFSTAAICNQCSIGEDDGEKIGVEESSGEGTVLEDQPGESGDNGTQGPEQDENGDEDGDENGQEDEDQIEDAEAPTVSIKIYKDATYSPQDDVCYYRLEAVVTGKPEPDIKWSKDDSNNAFGDNISQVNLDRGEVYELKCTVENNEGSATDSMTLDWGCNGTKQTYTGDMELVESISGNLGENSPAGGNMYVGDDGPAERYKVFMSFDITDLAESEVKEARLEIKNIIKYGEPLDYFSYIYVHKNNYEDSIDATDFYGGGSQVFSVQINTMGASIVDTSTNLKANIQSSVDYGKEWFQLSFGLGGAGANDGDIEADGYLFMPDDISLEVTYEK